MTSAVIPRRGEERSNRQIDGVRGVLSGREWEAVTVGDIAEIVGGGTPSTGDPSNFDGEIPWLTPKDMSGPSSRFVTRGKRNLSQTGLDGSSARLIPEGSVLLSTRAPVGYVAIAANPISTNQGCRSLILRDGVSPQFIYYWITANRSLLERHASGSTFSELSAGALGQIRLLLPPVRDQETIGNVLGSLDDRIEQNGRTIATLDAMARAIFRDWFVDFGPTRAEKEGRTRDLLPDSSSLFLAALVDSPVGRIPEGWSVARFGDSFELTMGQSPPGSTYNTEGQGLPFLQGRADFGAQYAAPRRYCSAPARVAAREDTLVSVRAPIGSVNIARDRCCIGRGVAAVRHRSGSAAYTYQSLCRLRPVLESFESTGTVFGAVTKTQFESLFVVEPPAEVVEAFDRLVGPLHERVRRSVEASEKLGELRDRLGERLVSGRLRSDGAGKGSAAGGGDAGRQRAVGEAGEGRVTGATGC